jgi:hypothetical protein
MFKHSKRNVLAAVVAVLGSIAKAARYVAHTRASSFPVC